MACLSYFRREIDPAVVAANPIRLLSEVETLHNGETFEFEVFEIDSATLFKLIDEPTFYMINSGKPFWGRIKSLTPCVNSLPLLRDRPTLRGVVEAFPQETSH